MPPELGELGAELDRAVAVATGALDDLREIARGIHPAILAKGGLRFALKTPERSQVPRIPWDSTAVAGLGDPRVDCRLQALQPVLARSERSMLTVQPDDRVGLDDRPVRAARLPTAIGAGCVADSSV